ncbi:hypothetical protein GCM10010191_85570 [Actinomadura vinacea]|uniref:FAD-binding domain-containing protein n=1 Tax=Actinomadura vinacea TaxID=115336 RepID=A0ABN3KDJ9_9ACTN
MGTSREHAIVVGGSLAGLLAARVLSDHFDRVTLVERDRLPDSAAHRPGVPQGRHLHVLWSRGMEIAERLFPGLEEELGAAGAPVLGIPSDLLWMTPQGWRRRFEVNRLMTFSRELLDFSVRARLAKIDNVRVLDGQEVTGLIASTGGGVGGVEARERGTTGDGEPLRGDLVVDATGRGTRAPEWLGRLGFPEPKQTLIDPMLAYASRRYAIPSGFDPGWKALYLQADPPNTRTGALFPQEGGRWIVSLFGTAGDYPPTDDEGFLSFAKSLRSPHLYEAIKDAEPLTPISGYRRTANHRRHYEKMPRLPEGFVALGDSMCALNPLYGQGMSVAALSALTLDDGIRNGTAPTALAGKMAKNAAGAWLVATGEDMRYPTTKGASAGISTRVINRYVARVVKVANLDQHVCMRMVNVLALIAPPQSLFMPDVLWRSATVRARPLDGPGERLN